MLCFQEVHLCFWGVVLVDKHNYFKEIVIVKNFEHQM